MKLLQVDSSVLGNESVTRGLTHGISARRRVAHPETSVERLDLVADPVPHLGPDALALRGGIDAAALGDAQRRENALTMRLLAQFLAADVVVVGAPMYNFSVPTSLEAWIDRLARPGHTFRYTASGPVGLAAGKTVFVASGRGGRHDTSDPAVAAREHQESYLRALFGFFGITDIRVVRAEGVAMGAPARAAALQAAEADIERAVDGIGRRAEPVAVA